MRNAAALCLVVASLAACDDEATEAPAVDGAAVLDAVGSEPEDGAPPDLDVPDASPDALSRPDLPVAAPPPDAAPPSDADAAGALPDAAAPDAAPADAGTPPPRDPPAVPEYSHGECPALVGGPGLDSSLVEAFPSGDHVRSFRLVVPANYDGSEPWPLVFAWHWLNARSSSFFNEGELASATEQMRFIAVVPDALRNENGDKVYALSWPFAEVWGIEPEERFFDDLLACVSQQLNVDLRRVYGIGVSARALWLTYLSTTARADHFAAVESLSGGLGELGIWRMEYAPTPRKFPAFVLWGGPSDWLALSFADASMRYEAALVDDGHFVVECVHDAGHGMPPVVVPEGETRFRMLWRFMLDHDYDLGPNESPYYEAGLPDVFEDWCRIASQP